MRNERKTAPQTTPSIAGAAAAIDEPLPLAPNATQLPVGSAGGQPTMDGLNGLSPTTRKFESATSCEVPPKRQLQRSPLKERRASAARPEEKEVPKLAARPERCFRLAQPPTHTEVVGAQQDGAAQLGAEGPVSADTQALPKGRRAGGHQETRGHPAIFWIRQLACPRQ